MADNDEPWTVERDGIFDCHHCLVVGNIGFGAEDATLPDDTQEARIVACVNFCQGIPTEWLTRIMEHPTYWDNARTDIESAHEAVKA